MSLELTRDERHILLAALDTYVAELDKMAALPTYNDWARTLIKWAKDVEALRAKVQTNP